MLVVDGTDPDIVREILYKEKNSVVSRHEEGQRIFKSLADVAPAMGMIGTLIGLVQMLAIWMTLRRLVRPWPLPY